MNDTMRRADRGSAITIALFFTMVLGFLMGSYMSLAREEMQMAQRTYMNQSSLSITEAAAERTIYALLNEETSGWYIDSANDAAYRKLPNLTLYNGLTGHLYAFVQNKSEDPVMRVEGRVIDRRGQVARTQIHMELKRRPLFANGLTAKNGISFSGGAAYVDSYNSNNGDYNPVSNYNDNGSVGSISVEADAVSLSNAEIFGYVATGGEDPLVGPNGKVWGNDSDLEPGENVDWSRVTTDFFANFVDVSNPTLSDPYTSLPEGTTKTIGDPTGEETHYYLLDGTKLTGNTKLVIEGPVVMVMNGDISVSGSNAGFELGENGTVEIYSSHNISIGGSGVVNTTTQPRNFVIWGTNTTEGGQSISLSGNAATHAVVYAPNANFTINASGSSGSMMGAVVANKISVVGNANFHYDEDLADFFGNLKSWRLEKWYEITTAGAMIDFDAIAANPSSIQSMEL